MVDSDRVRRLLDRIKRDVGELAVLGERPAGAIAADVIALSAMKYLFVTAIEGCTRVAHHIAVSEGWPAAETNGDAVRQLGLSGVLTRELADALGAAVGFRNLLVHGYGEVDDARAVGRLDDLDDLRTFIVEVDRWLDATGG